MPLKHLRMMPCLVSKRTRFDSVLGLQLIGGYMNLDNIENIPTYILQEYKSRINEELDFRNKDTLRSKLWHNKIKIIKELSYRIKK